MAQRRTSARGRLAGRFGLRAGWGQAAGVVALVLAVGLVALATSCSRGSFEVVARDKPEAAATSVAASSPSAASGSSAAPKTNPVAVVHVDGAVANPGVYELAGDPCRIRDAVDAAGGLAGDADTATLNLAAAVTDGSKVHVPRKGEEATLAPATSADLGASAGVVSTPSSGPVNINTATAEQLDTLPGVGESTASAIIEDREANGPFFSPEDLMRVSGIGEKKFAKLKGQICV